MDMTPEELDAIRARHRNLVDYGPVNAAVDDVGALLVEVDRLRADILALPRHVVPADLTGVINGLPKWMKVPTVDVVRFDHLRNILDGSAR